MRYILIFSLTFSCVKPFFLNYILQKTCVGCKDPYIACKKLLFVATCHLWRSISYPMKSKALRNSVIFAILRKTWELTWSYFLALFFQAQCWLHLFRMDISIKKALTCLMERLIFNISLKLDGLEKMVVQSIMDLSTIFTDDFYYGVRYWTMYIINVDKFVKASTHSD